MKNHFHLLIRIKKLEEHNLTDCSQAFSNLFNAYTKTINRKYKRQGSLFQKPFKRILVDSKTYFIHLVNYIHRNPEKHQFTDNFRTYPYSSYQVISQKKNSIIKKQQVIDWFGTPNLFLKYHEQSDETKIQHLILEDTYF